MIIIPTAVVRPTPLASVVAVELLADKQQVAESVLAHDPAHNLDVDTVLPFAHSLGSLPVPLLSFQPPVLSLHGMSQQVLESLEAQPLPSHLPLADTLVPFGHV